MGLTYPTLNWEHHCISLGQLQWMMIGIWESCFIPVKIVKILNPNHKWYCIWIIYIYDMNFNWISSTDNGNLYWYQPFKIVCFQEMSYFNFPRYFAEPRVATLVKSRPLFIWHTPPKKHGLLGDLHLLYTHTYIYKEHRMRVSNIMGIGLCLSSFIHGNMLTNPGSSPAKNGRVFTIDWFDVSSSTHTRFCSRYLFVRIGNWGTLW